MNRLIEQAMHKTILKVLAALLLSGAAHLAQASAITVADWQFNERAGTSLNNTANSGSGLDGLSGPGSSWNVGITGLASNGTGGLNIGNDGKGGSGTRSAYADFSPDFAQISSGILSVFTTFSAWSLPSQPASFTMAFIEGDSFSTAQFGLFSSAGGYSLGGSVDPDGDGGDLITAALFDRFQPLTVRLDVDLDRHDYGLAFDTGSGFVSIGHAAIDSSTAGLNSLRFGVNGNFGSNALAIDRIWVMAKETPTAAVPEPASALLLLTALGLMLLLRAPARKQR
ncbi:hypothetical protein BH11PSE10_BH11PSE10_11130 [soil metagenome]